MDETIHRYKDEICRFFKGTLEKEHVAERVGRFSIISFGGIDILRVKPIVGGPYDIAIRFPRSEPSDEYRGYIAPDGYLWKVNLD